MGRQIKALVEKTYGDDVTVIKEILEKLRRLAKGGKVVVVVEEEEEDAIAAP